MPRTIANSVYQPLRRTCGLVPMLAGLDNFFSVLADWDAYLSPLAASLFR